MYKLRKLEPSSLQQLQTSCFQFTNDEDPGGAGPCPSPPSGESFYGFIILSTWLRSGQCHHLLPGQLTGVDQHLVFLDTRLPHQLITAFEDSGQGTGLATLLFTLYTADFSSRTDKLNKNFVDWCQWNHLQHNAQTQKSWWWISAGVDNPAHR